MKKINYLMFTLVFAIAILCGYEIALAQTAPAQPDAGTLIGTLISAIQGRNWIVLVGVVLSLVIYGLRTWGGSIVPWFKTSRGGVALTLIVTIVGTLATVLAAGKFNWSSLIDALAVAMTTAGGYSMFRKLFFPDDVAPAVKV
jgi:hypothetical protein